MAADLRRVTNEPSEGKVAIQARSGTWFHAERVIAVELVKRPRVIEGELSRSKGLFSLGEHLVSRHPWRWGPHASMTFGACDSMRCATLAGGEG